MAAGDTLSAMVIRDADPARDAAACAEIYAPHVVRSAISLEEEPPDAAQMAGRIRAARRTHAWLVAQDAEGRVAGYAYAGVHRERAAYRWAADVGVYVAATHVRRGVGLALYGELLERLRAGGLRVACAGITLPNDASIALHRSIGFEPVGVYRAIGHKLGAWRDVSWWQLALAPELGSAPPGEPRR